MPQTPSAGELAAAVLTDVLRGVMLTLLVLAVALVVREVVRVRRHRRELARIERAQARAERLLGEYQRRTPGSSITNVRVLPAQREER